jgi:hypothetical protein
MRSEPVVPQILAPFMRQQMPFIASWQAFGITPETAGLLCRISPATIGRYLKKDKAALKLKGKSLTKPLDSLKSRIPIRTFYTSEERETPGFWQIDTVHHRRQATQGQYLHTLTATDVCSGWIALYSLLNNAHKWTFEALSDLKGSSLLPIREPHSDNGSEFINNATESWCRQERLPFTRSRDHKKNDNCFVEQKNSYNCCASNNPASVNMSATTGSPALRNSPSSPPSTGPWFPCSTSSCPPKSSKAKSG